ncbi:hypothetical protein BZARG_484 [Bizionia argentinensis JUB59]|uniref:Lipoprotein n=1 Tax=Bizionia argentinensis JUB59 TaxID=1046627 RepID=G2EH97_9FLAO|nr:hypothetical protein [Bizionia argentinensis]EGV42143.1 hypothetical protein BZARG_484 [Bizionia argentinensis JUB59]
MKYLKIVPFVCLLIASSCATKHQVITDSGEVYEVHQGQVYKQGQVVTGTISSEEKQHIISTLDTRLESEAEILAEKDSLDQIRINAEIEANALERQLKDAKAARDGYIKAKNNFEKSQKKYQRLHDQGDLSPNDEAKWAMKLDGLSEKVLEAEETLNTL